MSGRVVQELNACSVERSKGSPIVMLSSKWSIVAFEKYSKRNCNRRKLLANIFSRAHLLINF